MTMGNGKNSHRLWILRIILVFGLLLIGCSDQKPSVYRVGILCGVGSFIDVADGFKRKMYELDYAEGKNIVYDLHNLNADPEGERRIARKFVADKVDLIFAFPTNAALEAKAAAHETKIPVVFAHVSIEGNNLVESVRHPGGNVAGVYASSPDQTLKRFEILCELVPSVKRIYITYDPNYPGISKTLDLLRKGASLDDIRLVEAPVVTVEELKADLNARSASPEKDIDAILIMPTPLTNSPEVLEVIRQFAMKHKMAIAGSTPATIGMGAVFSYSGVLAEEGRLAAQIADKIFKGAPAGELPLVAVESVLRINYRRARELGLNITEGLLRQAKEIIK